ncbi:hypothetical protein MP228_005120 [Amoeboaphelidium protococcarum]|nr:hypothetical protein MP228_005120 [Amoeboaphelidium protococcarum]
MDVNSAAFWIAKLQQKLSAQPFQKLNQVEAQAMVNVVHQLKQNPLTAHSTDYLLLLELVKQYQAALMLRNQQNQMLAAGQQQIPLQQQQQQQQQMAHHLVQQQQQQQQQQQLQQQTSASSPTASVAPSMDGGKVQPASFNPTKVAFNDVQAKLLKLQIAAYRYLSKNVPVPAQILAAIATLEKQLSEDGAASVDTFTQSTLEFAQKFQNAKNQYDQHQQQVAEEQNGVVESENPQHEAYKHLVNGEKLSNQRLLVPSIMPAGLDPLTLRDERESRIKSRIAQRIQELESMSLDDLPDGVSGDNQQGDDISSSRLNAIIELKSLRLLEKQKALRAQILSTYNQQTSLQTALSRHDYRRAKKTSVREIRVTEKMERQQRVEREKKEKQKHYDYLNSVCNWGKEMLANRKALSAKQMKLGRAVLHWHTNVEKEEAKKQERLAKERIKALKADDEEAYLKLLDKQKDTRLTHLLSQTDSYLDTLSTLVQAQQDHIASQEQQSSSLPPAKPTDFGMGQDEAIDKQDYYSMSHRIREPVTQQPSIMIGGTLKEYQLKGLEWMVSLYNNKLNGILADEMGLGKTIQTISLISFLIEKKNQNGPYLVIVPLSTITNWSIEFEKWAPSIVKVVYKGSQQQRKSIQASELRHSNFNVLLTTYEYIIKDKSVLGKYKWVYTIIDEGHRMKNAHSKLSITLTQFYSSRYRLILTGTPLQNNLPELWALLNFVLPKVFNSVKTFDDWFNTPFANTGERIELNEEEQLLIIKRLHKVLRPFLLRRLKKDVESDLPDKTERILKTNLSSLQQKLYSQVRQSGAMMISSGGNGKKVGVRSINNTVMQLRKICNHPFVFEEVEDAINPSRLTNDLIYRTSGKFELLNRILPKFKATNHRILIFFQMTHVMDIMEDFLRFRGFKYLRLDGSTKSEDRSALLKLYNAPDSDYFIFILSTRAGGLGLNLQSADTVIIFDSDWNPTQDLQAQDRAHRIGQTKEVRVFRLITANSIEESILARAQYKMDLDGKIIQAGKFDNKSSNEERDAALRSLFENDPENMNDVNDVEDEDELNEIISRSDQELELFKKMDAQTDKENQQNWRSMGGSGTYPRLMALDELPEIYLHDFVPVAEDDDAADLSRGRRAKSGIMYNDGLTDDQWARAIDKEQDIDEVIQQKKTRGGKRGRKPKQSLTAVASNNNNGSDDESLVEAAQNAAVTSSGRKLRKTAVVQDDSDVGSDEEQFYGDEPSSDAQPNRKRVKMRNHHRDEEESEYEQ